GWGGRAAATLEKAAADLAEVGRPLPSGGDLRRWSCHTGAGSAGSAFTDRLAQITGATIAAALGLVGAAVRGGSWMPSSGAAAAPLTDSGLASYAGVLVTKTWVGGATFSPPNDLIFTTFPPGAQPSGGWALGLNWPNGLPAPADTAVLEERADQLPYTVTLIPHPFPGFSGNVTGADSVDTVTISGTDVTLDLNGHVF